MLIIEMQFPAGRFHATPWGRNVNEGEPEWPPSPYRLARAVVDVWKRRRPLWPAERMLPILDSLSSEVKFFLPPASIAHTRSFLSSNDRDLSKKQLIFDAFVVIGREDKVLMGFEKSLPEESIHDLDSLLSEINYLGRSESWGKIKVAGQKQPEWNCLPNSGDLSGKEAEIVRVACLISPDKFKQNLGKSISLNWLDAICMSTKDLLSEGWSNPPALQWVDFLRAKDALTLKPAKLSRPFKPKFRFVKYALSSKVLPNIL